MAHAVGKDDKGRYWFRSKQKLVDVTNANKFIVRESGFWFWKKWEVISLTYKNKARHCYGYLGPGWDEEVLGVYDTQEGASTALECLMHMRDVELIMF